MTDTPHPPIVLNTAHIGFTVDDLDGPIEMFRDLFGYALVSLGRRHPPGVAALTGLDRADIMVAHLEKDGLTGIELIAYSQPDDRRTLSMRPCDTGFVHISFHITDMDAMIARSARHGLRPIGKIVGRKAPIDAPGTGKRVAYLREANGISIEYIEFS